MTTGFPSGSVVRSSDDESAAWMASPMKPVGREEPRERQHSKQESTEGALSMSSSRGERDDASIRIDPMLRALMRCRSVCLEPTPQHLR